MRNFRQFDFWVDSKKLAVQITKVVKSFPKEEQYALCDQLRRASVSIASNIAEGSGRDSNADFAHFLDMALGSAYEVETQIEIAKDLEYINTNTADEFISQLQSIERRITAFSRTLRRLSND